jgi:hypothetical protein
LVLALVMDLAMPLAAPAAALPAAPASSGREARLREAALDLQPGDRLLIIGIRGSVKLQPLPPGSAGTGVARGKKSLAAGASAAARDIYAKIAVAARREGQVVYLEPTAEGGGKLDWLELAQGGMPELSLEVEAPPGPVDVAWREGRVTIAGWKGALSVDLLEGSFASRQTEGAIRLQIQRGDAKIDGHRGRLELDSHVARLYVAGVDGDVASENLGGDTVFQGVKGNVQVRASAGATTIAKGSGSLEFESGAGAVTVSGFAGSLRGQAEDGPVAVQVDGDPEVNIESARAPISIRVPAGSGASVRASTEEGQLVVPEPPLKVLKQPALRSVAGRLSGSGAGTIFAKSKTATIQIR